MSQVLKSICPRRIPYRQSQCAHTQTTNGFSRKHGSWRDERHSGLGVTVCYWSGFQSGNQNVTVITPELVHDCMTLKGLPKQEARGRMIHPQIPSAQTRARFLLGNPVALGANGRCCDPQVTPTLVLSRTKSGYKTKENEPQFSTAKFPKNPNKIKKH